MPLFSFEGTLPRVHRSAFIAPTAVLIGDVLALGAPATVNGPLAGTAAAFWVRANPSGYQALAQRHTAGVAPV